MGWFTNRNKVWEIKQTLILLGVVGISSFLSLGVLTPIFIFAFGSQVKISRWTQTAVFIGMLYLAVLFIVLFGYILGVNPTSFLALNYISFYIYIVYLSISVPEYLQRLDLKNYINLEKGKEYSYYTIMDQLNYLEANKSIKESFLSNLKAFKRQITNSGVSNDVDEIIRLIDAIIVNETVSTDLLLERHVSTIENSLIQYIELSNSYHKSEQVMSSIHKLEELIKYARIALENELSMMIENQVLDVDGEASVYLSVLKGRGLL